MMNDVIVEILTRLPVKSLLKFKCVCKSWYSLIKSQSFIDLQLGYASAVQDNYIAILKHSINESSRIQVSYLSDNKDVIINVYSPQPVLFFDEWYDELGKGLQEWFTDSCNGIICVCVHYRRKTENYRPGDLIALWNPTTCEIKRLPLSNVPREDNATGNTMEVGFGFDVKSKDYKVVRILDYDDFDDTSRRFTPLVEVYSLSVNCWRKIDVVVPTYFRMVYALSTYLDGFYYWWSGGGDGDNWDKSILTFDFANEMFAKLAPPDLVNPNYVTLVKYKDYVALLAADDIEYQADGTISIALWVLSRNDDDTPTWDKLFKFSRSPGTGFLGFFRNGCHLECYDYKNEVVEENLVETVIYAQDEYCHLIIYDPSSQQVKCTVTYDEVMYDSLNLQLVSYVQSLVSLKNNEETANYN